MDKKYFEFSKQDYYGLVTVDDDPEKDLIGEATEVYVERIAGETIEGVIEEGYPREVSREYAFLETR